MAKRQRDPEREAYWRGVVARQQNSGLTVRGFCQGEHLAESSFHAWRRVLKDRDLEKQGADAQGADVQGRPAFVPVIVRQEEQGQGPDAGGQIVVELRGGRVMRLPASMPADHLARIVHAIEGLASHVKGAS